MLPLLWLGPIPSRLMYYLPDALCVQALSTNVNFLAVHDDVSCRDVATAVSVDAALFALVPDGVTGWQLGAVAASRFLQACNLPGEWAIVGGEIVAGVLGVINHYCFHLLLLLDQGRSLADVYSI